MAGIGKFAIVFMLSLALLLPSGFCAWNQTINVKVADQNGLPVDGASIRITYQKANGITGNDGLAEGKTGEDGSYTATILNSVPSEYENRNIKVEASTYYWQGSAQELAADAPGAPLQVSFTAPVALGKVTITVLRPNGRPASGASIFITGSDARKAADANGKAVLYLPVGTEVSGFASYGSDGDYFSSSGAATGADGGREILVKLPPANGGTGGAQTPGSTLLTVTFVSANSTPVGGEKATFFYDGAESSAYTDANGAASTEVEKSGEVRASMRRNGYDYSFTFNVTADGKPKSETAALYPLLKIEYFESVQDGAGCYRLSAKVSDPRSDRPISVKMAQMQNGTQASSLAVSLDENGMYSTRVCAGSDALVRAVASNAYESVEKTIMLSAQGQPAGNQTAQQNATRQPILPPPIRPTSPTEGLEVVLVVIAVLVTLLGASALVLGRRNPEAAGGVAKYFSHTYEIMLGSTVRPIVEYLRSLLRRREPPLQPPVFQQPPPMGPMMPPA